MSMEQRMVDTVAEALADGGPVEEEQDAAAAVLAALSAAGYRIVPADELERTLETIRKVAALHVASEDVRVQVDESGETIAGCTECGRAMPCRTDRLTSATSLEALEEVESP